MDAGKNSWSFSIAIYVYILTLSMILYRELAVNMALANASTSGREFMTFTLPITRQKKTCTTLPANISHSRKRWSPYLCTHHIRHQNTAKGGMLINTGREGG